MFEEENQMGLFEMAGAAPDRQVQEPKPAPPTPTKPMRKKVKPAVVVSAPAAKKVSGLVPDGDVRLTANIRQDLHLKLKIASAHRRTTIGEIIEELIEKHLK
jgi:hypothetical protein